MEASVVFAAHTAAGLVFVAGAGKVLRPTVASEALALTRVPGATWVVRLLGAGEVALAATVLAVGGRVAFALLAIAYVAFIVIAELQRRRGRSCGCFGASTSTVGPLHLGVDAVAAFVAGYAAVVAAPGLLSPVPASLLAGGAVIGLSALAVALARLVLTALPELLAAQDTGARA